MHHLEDHMENHRTEYSQPVVYKSYAQWSFIHFPNMLLLLIYQSCLMKILQYRHIFIFLILYAVPQGTQTPINTHDTPVVWGTSHR